MEQFLGSRDLYENLLFFPKLSPSIFVIDFILELLAGLLLGNWASKGNFRYLFNQKLPFFIGFLISGFFWLCSEAS